MMLVVPVAAMVNEAAVPSQTVAEVGWGEIVMVPGTVTVKLLALVTVLQPTVISIGPVVAPVGTDVVRLAIVLLVIIALTPLNFTILLAGIGSKFVPEITTVVPIDPDEGVILVMVGGISNSRTTLSRPPISLKIPAYSPLIWMSVILESTCLISLSVAFDPAIDPIFQGWDVSSRKE
jgi:hypothetical protein